MSVKEIELSRADETMRQLLRASYADARRKGGLIDFTRAVRTANNDLSGKYSIHLDDLSNLFSKSVWKDQHKPGGHRKLTNIVTGVVIEYSNHKSPVDPGAVMTILDGVQKHLNILCNKIFCYKTKCWKAEPDYTKSIKRMG